MTDERDNRPKSDHHHRQQQDARDPFGPPLDDEFEDFFLDDANHTDLGRPSGEQSALEDPPTIELDPDVDIVPVQLARDEHTGDADVAELPADAIQPGDTGAPEAAIFRRRRRTTGVGTDVSATDLGAADIDDDEEGLIEITSGAFEIAEGPGGPPPSPYGPPPVAPRTAPIDVMEALEELPTHPPTIPVAARIPDPAEDDFFASSDALDSSDYGQPVEDDDEPASLRPARATRASLPSVANVARETPPAPPVQPPPPNIVSSNGWTDAVPRADGWSDAFAAADAEADALADVSSVFDDAEDAPEAPAESAEAESADVDVDVSFDDERDDVEAAADDDLEGGDDIDDVPFDIAAAAAQVDAARDDSDDPAAEPDSGGFAVAVDERDPEVARALAASDEWQAAPGDDDEVALAAGDDGSAEEPDGDVAEAAEDDATYDAGFDTDDPDGAEAAPQDAAADASEPDDDGGIDDEPSDDDRFEHGGFIAEPSRHDVDTAGVRAVHDARTIVREPLPFASLERDTAIPPVPAVPPQDDADLSAPTELTDDTTPPDPEPSDRADAAPAAPGRPDIDALPLDGGPPQGANTWLTRHQLYQVQVQGLARTKQWQRLAAVTAYAILHADFAVGATRASMLLDLARVYRDRLDDMPHAQQAFEALAAEDPANAEALAALGDIYEARGDQARVFDLYLRAVERTWDPNERLTWTRRCAEIARTRLGDVGRTIAAWEQLWQLEDGLDEAANELATLYRSAERWGELSSFLERQLDETSDPTRQLVLLRQLVEIRLTGVGDRAGAAEYLHRILKRRPGDTLATRQLARIYVADGAWDELGALAPSNATLSSADIDRLHRIAGVLWDAERIDDAVALYDRIRTQRPDDALAADRRRAWLARTGRWSELLATWETMLAESDDDAERIDLFVRAAEVAETHLGDPARAAAFLEKRLALGDDESAFRDLTRLYRALGDDAGVARSLEGRVRLAALPDERREALRELANHYADRLDDADGAERCWRAVLAIDATDQEARDALVELHRARGDHQALVSALDRQLRLTTDVARAESLARRIATTVDEHFSDVAGSIDAWQRVLDYAPDDQAALAALRGHVHAAGAWRHEYDIIQRQVRLGDNVDARIDLVVQAAELLEEHDAPGQALAEYERVLRLRPSHPDAVAASVRLHASAGDLRAAVDVLEDAAISAATHTGRATQLRTQLSVLPDDAYAERTALLRRCLLLGDDRERCLSELTALSEASGEWSELADVFLMLALDADSSSEARTWIRRYAELLEQRLDAPERAFAALQAMLIDGSEQDELLGELARLSEAAHRHEDIVAIARSMAAATDDPGTRAEHLRRAAAVCERQLADPLRAFREMRRLLAFDPDDELTLRELLRLAEEHDLWTHFDAALVEVGDRTADGARRVRLLTDRQKLARGPVADESLAMHLGLRRLRHAPGDVEEQGRLVAATTDTDSWRRLLPVLEAGALCAEAPDADELVRLAALRVEHAGDDNRAFDLCRIALTSSPAHGAAADELVRAGTATGRRAEVVATLRDAAARSADAEHAVALLRRAVSLCDGDAALQATCNDLHRRLVELRPDELPSLRAMITLHRDAEQWWDLRDRLGRLVEHASADDARVAALLEIAELSDERLGDAAAAISACRRVLALEPGHAGARERLEQLVSRAGDPTLRLSTLQLDLQRADDDTRPAVLLEIAQVQQVLDEPQAAITTLRTLVAEHGVAGEGFEPLAALLREHGPADELVDLLLARADAIDDQAAAVALVRDALDCVRFDPSAIETTTWERILRTLLEADPDAADVRSRLLRLLRAQGRSEEWLEVADAAIASDPDHARRRALSVERARVLANHLDRIDDAEQAWTALGREPELAEAATLARATLALRRGDIAAWAAIRREHASTLAPERAALVLCHLAEAADEHEAWDAEPAELYREARRLDPTCGPAIDALKAIGRRLPRLRPAAALLPEEGEREMSWPERATRLCQLAADAPNPRERIQLLERTVATDPDHVEGWLALADALARAGREADGWEARAHAWWATVRRDPVDPARLADEAESLYQLALRARAAGDEATWTTLVRDVHDRVPHHVAAGRVAAQAMVDAGQFGEAARQLDALVRLADRDTRAADRAALLQLRGQARHALDDVEGALGDLREATHHAPLQPEVLRAASALEASAGDLDAAREFAIRALVSEPSSAARAGLLLDVGRLWERDGDALDEAGACFEMALGEGLESRELLDRVFRHYQRSRAVGEGLSIVDDLIGSTADDDTAELARLWTARGELLAASEEAADTAVEAFDMALSYDPARTEAREGLAAMLERRGDWEGLVQILEAVAEGADELRAATALRRIGEVCARELGDPTRAERYLRASIERAPERDAIAALAELLGDDPGRRDERLLLLGQLAAQGPPWMEPAAAVGRALLDDAPRRAWCVLSPMLMIRTIDDDLKARLRDMRRDYEKPPVLAVTDEARARLWESSRLSLVHGVMADLDRAVALGERDPARRGADELTEVSVHSSIGRTCAALAEQAGVERFALSRAGELDEPIAVLEDDDGVVQLVIRADIFQQMARAEVGFVLAYAFELTRAGARGFVALQPSQRHALVPGLWHALDFAQTDDEAALAIAQQITDQADDDALASWKERLSPLASFDPTDLGAAWTDEVTTMALRVALVAGADIYQIARLLSRMDDAVDRPGVYSGFDAFDEYVACSHTLSSLLAFAASPEFTRLHAAAIEVGG